MIAQIELYSRARNVTMSVTESKFFYTSMSLSNIMGQSIAQRFGINIKNFDYSSHFMNICFDLDLFRTGKFLSLGYKDMLEYSRHFRSKFTKFYKPVADVRNKEADRIRLYRKLNRECAVNGEEEGVNKI